MLAVLLSLCRRRHARRAAVAVPPPAMPVMLLSLSPLPLRSPCRCGRAHRNAARRSPVPPPPCAPSRRAVVAVPAAAMLVMLLSLSPLPLRSPCRCGRAHRNAARRPPVPPPPCSPCCCRCAAAAMLAVLLSLCRSPPCPSCCSRCPRYRYARRAAVAGLTGMLPDGRPCHRRHARRAAVAVPLPAMPVMLLSLSPLPLRSPCHCGRAHRHAARRPPVPPPPCSPCCCRCAAAAMLAVLLSLCRPPPCPSCCSRCLRYRYARRAAVAGLTGMLPDG
ncbi:hypothetical protein PR001_g31978, partial [Phytophthora rubi]